MQLMINGVNEKALLLALYLWLAEKSNRWINSFQLRALL